MLAREFPKAYIETAISLLKSRALSSVVEIGSMRQRIEHPLDEVDRRCCLDGHSSMFFASATDDFTTVDIDFWTSTNAGAAIKRVLGKYVNVICRDGIEFLRDNSDPIDLLFLDAWDAFLPLSAEHHLEAFQAAESELHDTSMVLIDDTDVDFDGHDLVPSSGGVGGKGRLLIPYMEHAGWAVVFHGRQTLMVKKITPGDIASTTSELRARRESTRDAVLNKYPDYYSKA